MYGGGGVHMLCDIDNPVLLSYMYVLYMWVHVNHCHVVIVVHNRLLKRSCGLV